jgi:multidrug efflux pump subunit AcrA (membrane-fusion protein)
MQQVELPPPPPPPPTAKKRRRWPWVLGVVIVLAIIGTVVGDDLDTTDETGDVAGPSPQQPSVSVSPASPSPVTATTTVPDLEGRSLASAQRLLESAGLDQ